MVKYGLKFISGKYQGAEYPVPTSGHLVIGRANNVDLVLVEDMVSRKHARLTAAPQGPVLEDLNSTNGTYVNGERIEKRDLGLGDRILIGTSIFKIIEAASMASQKTASADRAELRAAMNALANRAPSDSAMSGELEDVPLPDLLLLFATNKKSGVLQLTAEMDARLYLRNGVLLHAVVVNDESPARNPLKTLCRLLQWTKGTFHFETSSVMDVPALFHDATQNVLLEASRQNDEAKRLISTLPSSKTGLRLARPLPGKLADLTSSELDLAQLVHNFGQIQTVVDHCEMTDLDALTGLGRLLKAGIVVKK